LKEKKGDSPRVQKGIVILRRRQRAIPESKERGVQERGPKGPSGRRGESGSKNRKKCKDISLSGRGGGWGASRNHIKRKRKDLRSQKIAKKKNRRKQTNQVRVAVWHEEDGSDDIGKRLESWEELPGEGRAPRGGEGETRN